MCVCVRKVCLENLHFVKFSCELLIVLIRIEVVNDEQTDMQTGDGGGRRQGGCCLNSRET